jgi:hypothetical protein
MWALGHPFAPRPPFPLVTAALFLQKMQESCVTKIAKAICCANAPLSSQSSSKIAAMLLARAKQIRRLHHQISTNKSFAKLSRKDQQSCSEGQSK